VTAKTERSRQGVYNVVVIGAGTAGLVTAAGTAGLGGRVALVERGRMGGDCLNTGCVPSKALISSARLVHQIRHARRWGLAEQPPQFRFEDVMERMRERRGAIAPNDSSERFESLGVDVVHGSARFVSPYEVEVNGARLRARNFVIATGSRAGIPPVEGLADAGALTNETIFDELRTKPDRMVILGGGPIGCELGQAFARLGILVTIVQTKRLLEKEDADVAELVRRRLEAEGVRVLTGTEAKRVSRDGTIWSVQVQTGERAELLEAEAVLVAAGRVPNVEGLDLERARVAHDEKGIKVDAHLRTSQPHIYAAGDVAGGYQFTHLADHHARVVVRNILVPWPKSKVGTSVLPWCTYTSPEVGRVGLNEEQAAKNGTACDVWVQPMREVDRAVIESQEAGFAKVLTHKGSDRILGATIVSEHGGDLIHELALAMKAGVGLRQISGMIHAYPTFAEVARKAADRYQKSRLTPLARRAFASLYRWQRGTGG
jgi:pyruvate/2-oxoglutarate dehydrogenase complex dihydrolipoamide dehydrogenase (E3) component